MRLPVYAFLVIQLLISAPANARMTVLSPARAPGEKIAETIQRIHRTSPPAILHDLAEDNSAWGRRGEFETLDPSLIPELASLDTLVALFRKVRDLRAWNWDEKPEFARRLPWLYPADGCFVRTAYMAEKFMEWGYPPPRQILIFGDLTAQTPYESVTWWYHVAPVYRVGGEIYVIDPPMNLQAPLKVADWALRMSDSVNTPSYASCRTFTRAPSDDCDALEDTWDPSDRQGRLQEYLASEWVNLESLLGSSPEDLLGDHPPWNRWEIEREI